MHLQFLVFTFQVSDEVLDHSFSADSKSVTGLKRNDRLFFKDNYLKISRRRRGRVVRALDLKSGGPGFKSSTLLFTGCVLGCPEFNLSVFCQLGFLTTLCLFTMFVSYLFWVVHYSALAAMSTGM